MANEYLTRKPTSTGNRKVFTWSAWIKRDNNIEGFAFGAGTSNSNRFALVFNGSGAEDITIVNTTTSNTIVLVTERKYRDFSSWIHFLITVDTTRLEEENRVRFYINGDEENFRSGFQTYPSINADVEYNNLNPHVIGVRGTYSLANFFTGQMSDVFMVDGQALTPDVFGFYKDGNGYISAGSTQATDFRPGQWVPKTPRVIKAQIERNGGFGVNGFYLPMNDSSNFGADFHTTPNSIITLKGEDLPQPRNGAPTTTDAYVSQLREDPYAANLVLAVPGILGAPGVAYTDFSANIKGSGTNKVITANGDAGVAVTASYYGSALSFDGSGDYFSGPTNDSDFQPSSNDFTVECWVNPKTLSANGGFCGIWDYTNNQRSWIFYHGSDGTPYFQVSSNGTSSAYAQSGIALTTNQWSHVVGEKYGNIITVYVNGVATGINTNGPTTIYTNTGDPLIIGDYGSTPADPFNGYIQDLRVYKGVAKYKGGFDVPKPYTPVGIATWRAVPDTTANNFATLNPLNNKGTTLTNGNLTVDTGTTNGNYVNGTIGFPKTGKWYWEYVPTSTGNHTFAGIGTEGESSSAFGRVAYYAANGQKYVDGTASAYGSTYTNNDIIGVAANIDSTAITFYKNGVSQGDISYPPLSGVTTTYLPFFADGAGATGTVINVNFGQNPTFSGNTTAGTFTDSNGKGLFKYEPPSGFLALCEDNLPTPAIKNPGEHFKTVLWTGTGASRNVVGVGFTPDLVWIKDRTGTAGHALHDSVRLPSFRLNSSSTNEESSESSSFISFSSDGFSLAGNDTTYNNTARNYVAWCWKAGAGTTTANTDGTIPSVVSVNQDAGFSIVSWTGTGSAGTIGHNLGKTPAFRIIKYRGTSNWYVWHKALAANEFLILNQTTAKTGSSSLWNNTLPTSSTISYTTATTSDRFIEYVWAEIEGFSKFGSYVGNGNADGPAVYCGFKPALVIFKRTDSTDNWRMNDNARGAANGTNFVLYPNLSNIEDQANDHLDYLSNGFKLRSTNNNASGGTYIFAAFAESPINYSNAK